MGKAKKQKQAATEDARVFISIPLPRDQKDQFLRAARAAGKTVAAWLRDLGAREIAVPDSVRVMTGPLGPPIDPGIAAASRSMGRAVIGPRIRTISIESAEALAAFAAEGGTVTGTLGHGPRKTAAEIAASIPGVQRGVGQTQGYIDVIKRAGAEARGEVDDLGEDVPTRPWLPELQKLQRQWELEPGEVQGNYHSLLDECGGRGKFPVELRDFRPTSNPKELGKRAAWLDEHHPLEAK